MDGTIRTALYLTFIFVFGLISCQNSPRSNSEQHSVSESTVSDTNNTADREPVLDKFGMPLNSLSRSRHILRRNQRFYDILESRGFAPRQIDTVVHAARGKLDMRKLQAGQNYYIYNSDTTGQIAYMVWETSPADYVIFDLSDSVQVLRHEREITIRNERIEGIIETSLYESVLNKGEGAQLVHRLAEIFGWKIDFFALRRGDRFAVLFEKRYVDGEFLEYGEVLAARFRHREETHNAYSFTYDGESGYYDELGRSVQKLLLKAPLSYSRISSGFSYSRFHPILKRRMPHLGIDYVAPRGTPVIAVGDGTVIESRYRGANGNICKIRHNSMYTTVYLHLSGFARGIYEGARVEQGQVIGYVGSTGRSTGPHLDYRIYVNGRPTNPFTINLPPSENLPEEHMKAFLQKKAELDRKLGRLRLPSEVVHTSP